MSSLGDKLRAARSVANLTMPEVAEVLGISTQAMWKYEHNKMSPGDARLRVMAKLYGVSVEWLLSDCPIEFKGCDHASNRRRGANSGANDSAVAYDD
jgi:transcriptional regulator with XRE-family HTH domain